MHSQQVLIRQLAVEYQGSGEEYEDFKRMVEASPLLYRHDFHFYNDDVTTRHYRNIAELKYIQQLLKDKKISPNMLATNTYNTFYPSYVLHHHYSVYLPMLKTLPQAQDFVAKTTANQITGAFFHETKTHSLKSSEKSYPLLDENGALRMDHNTFFYSLVTSPYIAQAAFITKLTRGGVALTIVNLRNAEGEFAHGIKTCDFGATISNDYLPIGYNFDGVRPLLIIPLEEKMAKRIGSTHLKQTLAEFKFSLKDLQKSLWITMKYTSMRRQFQTIDDSKEERRIITYQAVAARIADGFSQFQALSDLYNKIVSQKSYLLMADLLQSSHHVILESLIHLRECCGGFGYMQYSGHPGCMERVCNRAGNQPQESLKIGQTFGKVTQFSLSNPELQNYSIEKVSGPEVQYTQFFSVFLSVCLKMRKQSSSLPVLGYRREYLKQTAIISMHEKEHFLRYEADNIHCQILQYNVCSYVLKNTKFIDWSLIEIDPQLFFQHLERKKAETLQNIIKEIHLLYDTLELTYLRNTIVGREDEKEFYEELLSTSKNKNLRNSEEYRSYVREPIIEMLVEARAKM